MSEEQSQANPEEVDGVQISAQPEGQAENAATTGNAVAESQEAVKLRILNRLHAGKKLGKNDSDVALLESKTALEIARERIAGDDTIPAELARACDSKELRILRKEHKAHLVSCSGAYIAHRHQQGWRMVKRSPVKVLRDGTERQTIQIEKTPSLSIAEIKATVSKMSAAQVKRLMTDLKAIKVGETIDVETSPSLDVDDKGNLLVQETNEEQPHIDLDENGEPMLSPPSEESETPAATAE